MKIFNIVGARPQFIKASVISRILKKNRSIDEVLIHSGQHYDKNMSDIFFSELNITKPKYYIKSSRKDTDVQFGSIMSELRKIALKEKPDLFLVYGDTNTTLASAIVASKMSIKLAHIESGLRSYREGMDEEINRILTDRLSNYLFCNSFSEKKILEEESIKGEKFIVGDIMYDSYKYFTENQKHKKQKKNSPKKILLTMHRAENVDNLDILNNLIKFINKISENFEINFPIHPRTINCLKKYNLTLSDRIRLIQPLPYSELIYLLNSCNYVITDSGGLQKEAYFSKTKCFTIRDETEWVRTLINNANTILSPKENYIQLIEKFYDSLKIPFRFNDKFFGEGDAGKQIITILNSKF